MRKNLDQTVEKTQVVLYTAFLFLWFISSKVPLLRIASVVLLVLFSIMQVIKIIHRKKLFISKPVLFYIVFAVWCLLSVVWASEKTLAIDRSIDVICNSLFLMLSYDFFLGSKISKKAFITIFVIVGLVFSLYVFAYYGFGNYFSMLLAGRRVGNDIINVNFIGLVSAMTVIILFYSVLNKIYNNKAILLLSIPLIITTLGSGSRKALIGLVLGIALVIFFYLKGKLTRKKIITIISLFVLLIGSVFVIGKLPFFSTVFERTKVMFSTLDDESSVNEGSTEIRRVFIQEGFNTFLENPITGIGLNNSKIITGELVGKEMYLHCNYVEILACVGAIGFILYYSFYTYVIIKNIRLNKNKDCRNYLPLVLSVTLLVIEIGCVTYYEIKTAMYLVLMVVFLDKQDWLCNNKVRFRKKLLPSRTVQIEEE